MERGEAGGAMGGEQGGTVAYNTLARRVAGEHSPDSRSMALSPTSLPYPTAPALIPTPRPTLSPLPPRPTPHPYPSALTLSPTPRL